MEMKMTERKCNILKIIVEEFISTAQPIGSKTLLEKFHLPFSSATIRNEMQELEENGYLEKPHTSAGRIPSAKGYRFYIEHLRSHSHKNELSTKLESLFENRTLEIEEVIKQTSQLLSQMTNLTSIVLGPKADEELLAKIQLVPISENSAVVLIVTSKGYVEHRTFKLPDGCDSNDLQNCVDIMNERIVGTPLIEVNNKLTIIAPLIANRVREHEQILKSFFDAFIKITNERIKIYGQNRMFDMPEFTQDLTQLKNMTEILSKDDIWRNLTNRDGIAVKIGTENMIQELQNATIVTSQISVKGEEKGTIALIGPTRMDYDAVLDAVEFVTKKIQELMEGDKVNGREE